ncbi:MAG TPA: hypothetical protein VFR28_04375, partial [Allosphingosinicella sp.]|nr:hypothetical protein [Allosphingosinicella sp.]
DRRVVRGDDEDVAVTVGADRAHGGKSPSRRRLPQVYVNVNRRPAGAKRTDGQAVANRISW